jgi:hypothetical protein
MVPDLGQNSAVPGCNEDSDLTSDYDRSFHRTQRDDLRPPNRYSVLTCTSRLSQTTSDETAVHGVQKIDPARNSPRRAALPNRRSSAIRAAAVF